MINKKTFIQFLLENGFPFLNVYNSNMETIFGHNIKHYKKNNRPPKTTKNQKIQKKYQQYLAYAKVINEEQLK